MKTYNRTKTKYKSDEEYEAELYKLRTRRLKNFNKYRNEWYDDEKRYPLDSVELTPTVLKMWYVGDGDMSTDERWSTKHYARITSLNEIDRKEKINNLFENLSFEPNWNDGARFTFGLEGSKKFWEYIGDPLPGFEYKWPEKSYYI